MDGSVCPVDASLNNEQPVNRDTLIARIRIICFSFFKLLLHLCLTTFIFFQLFMTLSGNPV